MRGLKRRLDRIASELIEHASPPFVVFGEVDGDVRALTVLRYPEPCWKAVSPALLGMK